MPTSPTDAYGALRGRDFRLFFAGKVLADLGWQMQNTAVGWELYAKTGRALDLGWVGLAQVAPFLVLVIPAGHVADIVDRRRLIQVGQCVMALSSMALALASTCGLSPAWVFACLALHGAGKALQSPARSSLLPAIVPARHFTNAVTWNVSGFQLAMVLGPAAGGLLLHLAGSASWVYCVDAFLALTFATLLAGVRPATPGSAGAARPTAGGKGLAEGLRFVLAKKPLIASLTLDMLAVLFAGVTAILPIFARDILLAGPDGLGWLRAAPSVGAVAMSLLLAHRPPLERSGPALLLSVAAFSIATIGFGLSSWFPLSLLLLFLTGAFDMVSVVIRHTLVQTLTPDALRGRVSAVNGMFIGVSNELGALESGLAAHWLGAAPSVVAGGSAALLLVAAVAWTWPELRRLGSLSPQPVPPSPAAPAQNAS